VAENKENYDYTSDVYLYRKLIYHGNLFLDVKNNIEIYYWQEFIGQESSDKEKTRLHDYWS
jgi:hypothetical protein